MNPAPTFEEYRTFCLLPHTDEECLAFLERMPRRSERHEDARRNLIISLHDRAAARAAYDRTFNELLWDDPTGQELDRWLDSIGSDY